MLGAGGSCGRISGSREFQGFYWGYLMETLMHGALGRLHASVMPFRKWKIELSDYGTTLVIPKSFLRCPTRLHARAIVKASKEGCRPFSVRGGAPTINRRNIMIGILIGCLTLRRRGVGHRQGASMLRSCSLQAAPSCLRAQSSSIRARSCPRRRCRRATTI